MWYIGACIGSLSCGLNSFTWPAVKTNVNSLILTQTLFFVNKLFFKKNNFINIQIYFIGVSIFLCGSLYFWESYVLIVFLVRFIGGFSFGFIYIALLTQIADNAWKTIRGYVTTTISMLELVGMILAAYVVLFFWNKFANLNVAFNLISLILLITAMISTAFLTEEPISRLLKSGEESEAKYIIEKLYGETEDSEQIAQEIVDLNAMIAEDYRNYTGLHRIFDNENFKPIIWMALLRMLGVLTSNLCLMSLSAISIIENVSSPLQIHISILLVKFIVLYISRYLFDRLGRRHFLLVSGIGFSIFFIPFAYCSIMAIKSIFLPAIITWMHIFVAFGIEPVKHIYAAEAFPLSKRNASLALTTSFEYIFHAILIYCWMSFRSFILTATPFLVFSLSTILFFNLPETRCMNLLQCRNAFKINTN